MISCPTHIGSGLPGRNRKAHHIIASRNGRSSVQHCCRICRSTVADRQVDGYTERTGQFQWLSAVAFHLYSPITRCIPSCKIRLCIPMAFKNASVNETWFATRADMPTLGSRLVSQKWGNCWETYARPCSLCSVHEIKGGHLSQSASHRNYQRP